MNPHTHQTAVASSSRVTIELFEGSNALLDLKPIWNELLTESNGNTIFLTWEWAASWWHAFGSSFELCILKCSDSTHRDVGIIPLFRTRESFGRFISYYTLYLLGDMRGGSERLDWIVRAGWEQSVVGAVLDWLEAPALEWDILCYNTAKTESHVAAILIAECQHRNWFLLRRERPSYRVAVSASWDDYLATLSANMRSAVKRKIRRANKTFTLQTRLCETPDQLEKDLQTLYALHAKRWRRRGETGNLYQFEKQLFYHELAKNCLAKDWLEFWTLELNGTPAACEFGFRYDGVYSFLQGGVDPEYSAYAVGVVLRASIIHSLIQRGFRIYDFLLGEDDYKERWGGERYLLMDLSLGRPKSCGRRVLAAHDNISGMIRWLRTHTPEPVWSFARRAVRSVIGKNLEPFG